MSNEVPSSPGDGSSTLMERLEHVYRRYQQRHLYDRLDDIAETMEDTLLQVAIARELFEESIRIDPEVKQAVEDVREQLDAEPASTDASPVISEDQLDELQASVEGEAERIGTQIHGTRARQASTVKAMEALNEEVGLADPDRLAALASLLSEWEWRAYLDDAEDFEAKRDAAVEFATDMRAVLDRTQAEIGSAFDGEDIETLVDTLLDGGQLRLSNLSTEERDALTESTLGDHLTVSLG